MQQISFVWIFRFASSILICGGRRPRPVHCSHPVASNARHKYPQGYKTSALAKRKRCPRTFHCARGRENLRGLSHLKKKLRALLDRGFNGKEGKVGGYCPNGVESVLEARRGRAEYTTNYSRTAERGEGPSDTESARILPQVSQTRREGREKETSRPRRAPNPPFPAARYAGPVFRFILLLFPSQRALSPYSHESIRKGRDAP